MVRFLAMFAAAVVFSVAATAQARQDDARLDTLFEQLLATADDDEASTVQAEIWSIWIESGNADLDALMARGIVAMHRQQFDVALESFNALIEADADFAEGWNKRATLFYLMGRYDDSIRDVEHTLALEPRHFGALSGMGLILTAIEDDRGALEWFERALAVNPHMPFIRIRVEMLRAKLKGEKI
ncbi:MAG: tetratricopeptide repeat protein [Alphaproteobacteria bacterium]